MKILVCDRCKQQDGPVLITPHPIVLQTAPGLTYNLDLCRACVKALLTFLLPPACEHRLELEKLNCPYCSKA